MRYATVTFLDGRPDETAVHSVELDNESVAWIRNGETQYRSADTDDVKSIVWEDE